MATNVKVITTLVVLLFVAILTGCSTEKKDQPAVMAKAKPSISAIGFAQAYLDLERIERKYDLIFESFLKRHNIGDGEYRLVADSSFIASNPEIIGEYKKLAAKLDNEKMEVLAKSELTPAKYEDLIRFLSNGSDPIWADSVVAGIKAGQRL